MSRAGPRGDRGVAERRDGELDDGPRPRDAPPQRRRPRPAEDVAVEAQERRAEAPAGRVARFELQRGVPGHAAGHEALARPQVQARVRRGPRDARADEQGDVEARGPRERRGQRRAEP